MKRNNVLKEDRAASTIHIINGLVRGFTHKKQAKKVDTDYFVFDDHKASEIVEMIQSKAAEDAIVVDDLGLQIVDKLYHKGFKNITLILARLPKGQFSVVSDLIKRTFKNITIDIKHIEEIDYMKTDLLISNPAYGAIGANITDTLRQKIDYKEFINLLPANDYKRNATKDLFKYQSDMKPINDGFIDAAVTTHVARIHKDTVEDPAPNINMTLDEFERSQYIDRSLDKYFEENSKRTHYAIDNHICKPKIARFRTIDLRKCFYTGKRDLAAGHLPYSKDSMSYKINFNLLTDHDEFLANSSKSEQALGNSGNYTVVPFNTNEEKDNLIKFLYSKLGFKFICKLFTAINVDCYVVPSRYLPKVDWTHPWTVEEILKDYGYTEDEIKTVMADLDNFKGMDD